MGSRDTAAGATAVPARMIAVMGLLPPPRAECSRRLRRTLLGAATGH
ncbi:hypothetical protein ABZ471_38190 [Streptomyces sp. NPDC005728]